MQDFSQTAYADDPIYNMKAVTQRTGIPAATLRAWERRYHVLAPRRSDGNYRLYSERDIAILRWLQAQLNAGLSISRAVALLVHLRENDPDPTVSTPAIAGAVTDAATDASSNPKDPSNLANREQMANTLYSALISMDEQQAGVVMAEAFALYTVEDVCANLIAPTLVRLGDEWFEGHISVAQEHFASSYLMARLMTLFNSAHMGSGPLILVSCAPNERHELGALMLALLLRRAGHQVRYLGADMPLADLVRVIQQWRPRVVAISVVMPQGLDELQELVQMLQQGDINTHLVFGGRAFILLEQQSIHLQSAYVGRDLQQSLKAIEQLLHTEPATLNRTRN